MVNRKEYYFNESKKYRKNYNEDKFLRVLGSVARSVGVKILYPSLLLYTLLIQKNTPIHIKTTIIGALGYLVAPIDCIPDAMFGIGFGDDLSAILVSISTVKPYITKDIKFKARTRMSNWIKDVSDVEFDNLDGIMGI